MIMRSRQLKQVGFTLIELMVLLVIIGVGAAMATPYFLRAIRRAETRTAAEELASLINYSQVEASRRNQKVYVYPAFFRENGKLLGTAAAWDQANGMLAFIDRFKEGHRGVGQYDAEEEVRSLRIKKTLSLQSKLANDKIEQKGFALGFILYPTGEMKVNMNYHETAMGNAGYVAKIIVQNKKYPSFCHVLWIDSLGHARSCPGNAEATSTPEYIKKICACRQTATDR
ncbi:MAG: prepilin-type N-terminal cleavage/methylation domain-containing protein [Neisseriaceae bacterium]